MTLFPVVVAVVVVLLLFVSAAAAAPLPPSSSENPEDPVDLLWQDWLKIIPTPVDFVCPPPTIPESVKFAHGPNSVHIILSLRI